MRSSPARVSFAVNFLADGQKGVSDLFAGRVPVRDRFEGVKFHRGKTGSPLLEGARAVVDCEVWRSYDGGDHTIILGRVVGAAAVGKGKPLVYYAQQYTTTESSERPAPASDIVW
jgi:flavin reductase (DIM6/NTAB) family NADH-FMN oxidoreductase RutF